MPLIGKALEDAERLRERMSAAGCVFDFAVHTVMHGHLVTEMDHRLLLRALFEEFRKGEEQWRVTRMAQYPELADTPFHRTEYDLTQAQATSWNAASVTDAKAFMPGQRIHGTRSVASVSEFEWLFQAFDGPPYGSTCEPGLFADFCSVVGLLPGQGIEVLDWAGDPNVAPGRSSWSNYFDEGKDWWGIWCLTVWNPQRRTLAALAASSTD